LFPEPSVPPLTTESDDVRKTPLNSRRSRFGLAQANARLAGVTFLLYLVAGIAAMIMAGRAEVTSVLSVLTSFCALVLGVTLWAITREVDRDLAMMALACRVIEAAPGHGEIYFAVGSMLFSWLLLRGRMIPVTLAWLGVVASTFLVVLIPLQLAGLFGGARAWSSPLTWFLWLPMLVFEVALALWFLTKGVARPVGPNVKTEIV
jgi:hypothetical protein